MWRMVTELHVGKVQVKRAQVKALFAKAIAYTYAEVLTKEESQFPL